MGEYSYERRMGTRRRMSDQGLRDMGSVKKRITHGRHDKEKGEVNGIQISHTHLNNTEE